MATSSTPCCQLCQLPCDAGPRVRDSKGRLYHRACYESARNRARPENGGTFTLTPLPAPPVSTPQTPQGEASSSQSEPESRRLTPIDTALTPVPFNNTTAPGPASSTHAAAPAVMCPSCAAPLPAGAVLCTTCGYDVLSRTKRVTDLSYAGRPRGGGPSVVREFGYFGCGYGFLLIVFGILGVTMRSASTSAQTAAIMTWLSAALLIVPGLMNIAGGILAFTTRSKASIILCMVGSLALPIFYFGVPWLMGRAPGLSCMTVLLIVIPLTVINRAVKAIDELKSQG